MAIGHRSTLAECRMVTIHYELTYLDSSKTVILNMVDGLRFVLVFGSPPNCLTYWLLHTETNTNILYNRFDDCSTAGRYKCHYSPAPRTV